MKMRLIIARLEWMRDYQGDETLKQAIGSWAQEGNPLTESKNFLIRPDGKCYGWWRVGEKNDNTPQKLSLERWGETGDSISNLTVAFVAKNPNTQDNVVVGFYKNATVLRSGATQDFDGLRYRAVADAADVYLIPKAERIYSYPYRSKSSWFTYGNGESDDIALYKYINGISELSDVNDQRQGIEGRQRRWAYRLERFQPTWLRSLVIKTDADLICAACDLKQPPTDHPAAKRRFEVHHLEMVSKISAGKERDVTADDLCVLCACCHRTIHAADDGAYVANIPGFREKVLGLPKKSKNRESP